MYGEFEAVIDIETGDVIAGKLPKRALSFISEMAGRAYGGVERKLGTCAPAQNAKKDSASGVNAMNYHVIAAEYVSGYVIRLKFRDGTAVEIDLSAELTGPIFEPLRDLEAFKRFRVHPEFHTLVWPNGADLAPEFLHQNLRVTA